MENVDLKDREAEVPAPSTEPHTLLFVDDEESILNALRRLFYKEKHRILITPSAQEALKLIEAEPVALVISDHRMPEMEGTKLLLRMREIKPDTVRIMLTGYADMNAALEAINESRVYRFISKPWNDDDLRLTVREALRQYDMVNLNRELTGLVKQQNKELYDVNRSLEMRVLERTSELDTKNKEMSDLYGKLETGFLDTIQAFMGLMELKSASLVGHARRVSQLARDMANRLGLTKEEEGLCEMAGLLMDIGTIGYPDELLKKEEKEMDAFGKTLWEKHPLLGEASLKGIERLRPVSLVIRHHHERFDGKGFPDNLRADQIPMPARIVAAADYFHHLVNPPTGMARHSFMNALALMEKAQGERFEPVVVHALIDVAKNIQEPVTSDEVEVSPEDLAEGMTLAGDLKTRGGILLLPAGNIIQASHLGRILNFHRIDPIVDRIYVYRKEGI